MSEIGKLVDRTSRASSGRAFAATIAAPLALACGALALALGPVGCAPEASRNATSAPDPIRDPEPIESTGADTRLDLIRVDDPSAFACLVELGTRPGEFYDKVTDELEFPADTAFFDARFTDGTRVEIRVHPELGGPDAARFEAERIAEALGRLPGVLRADAARVGILGGDATAQADGGGEGIHLYRDNVETRIDANRFEETLFHETVHASLDDRYARSRRWLAAREADGRFLTSYARSSPEREDLAETALYAWALLHRPERVPPDEAALWRARVPARIEAIARIFPESRPEPPTGDECDEPG